MPFLDDFGDIVQCQAPLAPFTSLKVGGPAQMLAQPRTADELAKLVRRCRQEQLPCRVLGGGSNLLIADEGVRGLVVRLSEAAFAGVTVNGRNVRASAGAGLSALISEAARAGLAGLEALVGIPGTVGGALRSNAGSRGGHIGQLVRRLEILDAQGNQQVLGRDELPSGPPDDWPDDIIIVAAEFELDSDNADSILKRMRKCWIQRKAHQPLSFQAAGRIFKHPRGLAADQLIEQAGLQGTRVGGVEVSDRDANYFVAHSGATARDVLRLIDLVRSRVAERFGQHLELALVVWQ